MKHFIIEIDYKVPIETITDILVEHRAFLQIGYDKGMLLCSGPKEPRTGGMVVARSNNLEEVKKYFSQDPYALHKVAEHRFIEFNPVKFQSFLSEWIGE
jgi:uncharacterized protein YciI